MIIVDAYGDKSPQYAGVLNGVRIVNAVAAYKSDPARAPPSRVTCIGFSGGGIDCARVAEYAPANGLVDHIIVDSGPTDLPLFLMERTAVKRGLGYNAAGGVWRSLSAPQLDVLHRNLRPSAIVGVKLLDCVANVIPSSSLVTGFMTIVGGVVFPLSLDQAFLPGALEKPDVQAVLRDLNPDVPAERYEGQMTFRFNSADDFVPGSHVYPLAERYRAAGTRTTVIINEGATAPGHMMMPVEQLLELVNGTVPSGDVTTQSPEMDFTDKVTHVALSAALVGVDFYAAWLNEQAPPVLDELDRVVVDADQALDQVATASAAVTESAEQVAGQGQQVVRDFVTPQSEASSRNSETVANTARNWLPPQDARNVENFMNSTPLVKEVLDSAPVTLPAIPPPGGQLEIGGHKFAVPSPPALG